MTIDDHMRNTIQTALDEIVARRPNVPRIVTEEIRIEFAALRQDMAQIVGAIQVLLDDAPLGAMEIPAQLCETTAEALPLIDPIPQFNTMTGPTREHLIWLCEHAIAPQSTWHNRDSAGAHRQLGDAWALLKAGCDFRVTGNPRLTSDEDTWWIEIDFAGFNRFEYGDDGDGDNMDLETFYLPTAARVARLAGKDWY